MLGVCILILAIKSVFKHARQHKEREEELPVTADKPTVAPSVVPGVPVPPKLRAELSDHAQPERPATGAGGADGTPQHMHADPLPPC